MFLVLVGVPLSRSPRRNEGGSAQLGLVSHKPSLLGVKMANLIKVVVEIEGFEAKRVAECFSEKPSKRDIKRIAQAFAQNLIDRYFSTEYLDAEELEERYLGKRI
jgi:hypothetical protein